jgi:argininosuccinate lyase
MDVRGRRLRKQSDDAAAYTSSTSSDGRIAAHVVKVNLAHVASLVRSGVVDPGVGARCIGFLLDRPPAPGPGPQAEDFHQQLEQAAVDSMGVGVAGYLNLGKSRNDQVATAIRMELRERLLELLEALGELRETLITKAARDGATLLPGYTHLQRAQPVTLAHYAFAYDDAFSRDSERLIQAYARLNVSPMGSAALGGTSVPVDRAFVSRVLGFRGATTNAMDAVASRDFALEALSCATMVMIDVSRMAEEQILWSSREFGFVELADEYSASSSIMPQKKNPVVAEVARAKAGSVIGRLVSACSILKSLPNAYNLDLQEVTPHLWSALDDTIDSVRLLGRSFATAEFNRKRILESVRGDYSTATALADYLTRERSLSFRESHALVGELVRYSAESGTPLEQAAATKLPELSRRAGRRVAIDAKEAQAVLDPRGFLDGIATEGGANPKFIPKEIRRRSGLLEKDRARLKAERSSLESSARELIRVSRSIAKGVKVTK